MTLDICFWSHCPYLTQRDLFSIELMGKKYIQHYKLQKLSKYRNSLAQHYHRKLLLQWLWNLILVKVAHVDLCPVKFLGSQLRICSNVL